MQLGDRLGRRLGAEDRGRGVTYKSHPLYYYAGDSAAGQDSGQCLLVPARWYIVGPGGNYIKNGDSCPSPSPTPTPTGTPPPPPTPCTPRDADQTLSATAGNHGAVEIIVDGKGCTVYMFYADAADKTTSHCTGSCVNTWPPVLSGAGAVAAGDLSSGKVGSITRSDLPGSPHQVTYNGWPLYYYAPGDTHAGTAGGYEHATSSHYWYYLDKNGDPICSMHCPPS